MLSKATALLALSMLLACSQKPAPEVSETDATVSAQMRAYLDGNYAQDMLTYPQTASRRGILDNNDAWNPQSAQFRQQHRELLEIRLAQLGEFDPAQLDATNQLSWQLYQQELIRNIASDEFRDHNYVISHRGGVHMSVPTFLINVHKIKNLQNAQDYIARLNAVGPLFRDIIQRMEIAAEQGIFLPRWAYPRIIETAANTVAGAPFDEGADSVIWADFSAKLAALSISETQRQELTEQARQAMHNSVAPAYHALIKESQRLLALAPDGDGVWKHPNGGEFYAQRLNYYTTTDLSADEIHALGLREVARLQEEMRVIMEQVGFDGSLTDFFEYMRHEPRFYYSNDAAGRQRYLAEATALIDTIGERLPEVFGLFPKAELVLKRVEPFREKSAGRAFYQYPAADGSRPGYYYANLYDMSAMPIWEMEALAYHEGLPGHHMQRAITVELQGIPEFQKYTTFTAYTEGWGLYSELLPKEMGYYQDPYSDFGRLAMEIKRAARLVVDTGLHHKRWTRDQAIDYLAKNTPEPIYGATGSIERYIVYPGQATAYMIGKIKILELREQAREALGDKFDLRGFHDEVLKDGQVPLSILEDKINAWVARVKAGEAA